LSVVLPEDAVAPAVRDLHDAFFRGALPPEVFGEAPAGPVEVAPALPAGGREALLEIARRQSTPATSTTSASSARASRALRRALPGRLLFACKANAHPAILEHLAACGVGIEAASPGEVERALACGHAPESVLLSATNARATDLASIAERGCPLALGSIADVRKAGTRGRPGRVLLRINPGTGAGHHRHVITGGTASKFGIALGDLPQALETAHRLGLSVIGLHAHGGSGVTDPGPLLAAADALLDAARAVPDLSVVDFGGGFGIPYREGEGELDVEAYGRGIAERLASWSPRPEAWFEPGRYLVGPAGVLLATVTTRKESGATSSSVSTPG
jgi:diaminopimelate decarboxylase